MNISLRSVCCAALLALAPLRAAASTIPVATFEWFDASALCLANDATTGDCLGDQFRLNVFNTAPGSIANIFVQLSFDGGVTDEFQLLPHPVAPGFDVQDYYQFSATAVVAPIRGLTLDLTRLTISAPGTLSFSVSTPSPLAEPETLLTIVLDQPDAPSAAVPEPGSLLLVGGGLAAAMRRRLRSRR